MLNDNSISSIGEKGLIEIIKTKVDNNFLGDDAAVLMADFNNLLVSSDMLIQSHHFPEQMSYFQMGFKIVTVNVSDINAMGGVPKFFLLNVGVPKDLSVSGFEEIVDGVLEACKFYGVELVGGDTDEASEILLSGTVLGSGDDSLLKKGFKKGDLLCLTGSLGFAALGFHLLKSGLSGGDFYKSKILNPIVNLKCGEILRSVASSATDITDGLSEELYEMLDASGDGFGFKVYEDKLPLSDDFCSLAGEVGVSPLDLFFNFGEDFELVFTIDKKFETDLSFLLDFFVIGEVTDTGNVVFVESGGDESVLPRVGYEHLL